MADQSKRLEKAQKFLEKGKQDAALEVYLEILRDDPGNRTAQQLAADLSLSQGHDQQAETLLAELFRYYAGAGDRAKGVANYKKLARIAKPTVLQNFQYAELIEKTSRKEALDLFDSAAREFLANGQKQEALKALVRMVELDPSFGNLKRQGDLAAELGQKQAAASCFIRMGDQERNAAPKNPLAGAESYGRAYALDPDNSVAALGYASALAAGGEPEKAIPILQGPARSAGSPPELRQAYGKALLAAHHAEEAEPILWQIYEQDPAGIEDLFELLHVLIEGADDKNAVRVVLQLEDRELKAGRRREYITSIIELAEKYPPGIEFLEYLVKLYNSANREGDYSRALTQLFELYYAEGKFFKAGDALDRAVEVDPYEGGHNRRLEMLQGKIDANVLRAIQGRLQAVGAGGTGETKNMDDVPEAEGNESTVLEDLMLQAEIYLQYAMKVKALERVVRINKLFPREELKNEKLRRFFSEAGFEPKYAEEAGPAESPRGAVKGSPPAKPSAASPPPVTAPSEPDENAVDNITRVSEITRNIYRQANVKSVLFTAVNDIGRHWKASRCVAALCAPGKPPSAAQEYCAPGVPKSNFQSVERIIAAVQDLSVAQGAVAISNAETAPQLRPLGDTIRDLAIKSLLAIPLLDDDEPVGVIILEQCDVARGWRPADSVVLRTIADQTIHAVNNARLRNLMKSLAVTDEKSGLLKRASYLDVLLAEVQRALSQNSTSTLMLIHFGHASALAREIGETAIERMMQELGQSVCAHIRQADVAVRYELTTIALVLSDTGEKSSLFVVEKMRNILTTFTIPGTGGRRVPFTVGIAEAAINQRFDAVDIVTEVINRAESALEAAKAGVNKVCSLAPILEAESVA